MEDGESVRIVTFRWHNHCCPDDCFQFSSVARKGSMHGTRPIRYVKLWDTVPPGFATMLLMELFPIFFEGVIFQDNGP